MKILHTDVVNEIYLGQDQGHSSQRAKMHVCARSFHLYLRLVCFLIQLLSMNQGIDITLAQGHISRIKVTVHI